MVDTWCAVVWWRVWILLIINGAVFDVILATIAAREARRDGAMSGAEDDDNGGFD